LGLALIAMWLSRSIPQVHGLRRYKPEVLAALVNGIGLACVAMWIVKEAVVRLQSPAPEIWGLPMLLTALLGLAVNSFNVFHLHGCSHQDLNVKGVFLHVLADLVSSVGTVLAAIAVIWLNWTWADGVISLIVAGLIGMLAAGLVIQSINCLRGQVADLTDFNLAGCQCHLQSDLPSDLPITVCRDRQKAEKLLFPTLQDMI